MNKQKFLSSFAALALVFAACSNVDDPNPNGGEGEGGVAEGNYTVEEMCGMTLPDKDTGTETFTVEAYIVGSYNFDNDPKFVIGAENAATTSILIADDPEHTDTYNNIMAIKLGNYRDDVNLADNPSNYKKKIVVTGIFEKYCGIPGLVDLTKVVLDGKEIAAGSGNNQGDYEIPADAIFSETFADSQGDFTIVDVTLTDPLTYVWKYDDTYKYMKGSSYVDKTYEAESWLISPVIDLTSETKAYLSFEHAANFFRESGSVEEQATVWAREEGAEEWSQLSGINYSNGMSWTFVESGDVDLSAYAGGKMQFAFVYKSTSSQAGTWEVKNVVVKDTAEEVVPPTPDPDPEVPEGAIVIDLTTANTELTWAEATHDTYGVGFEATIDGVDLAYYKYKSTTNPTTQYNNYAVRVYKSSVFAVSTEKTMSKVIFYCDDYTSGGTTYCHDLTPVAGNGTYTTNTDAYTITWEGSSNEIVAQAAPAICRGCRT